MNIRFRSLPQLISIRENLIKSSLQSKEEILLVLKATLAEPKLENYQ